jgi:hypothetical protein
MRQSGFTTILRSDSAVPGSQLFGDSTKSTPHVQLSREKKKIERESENTYGRVQCYRLDPVPVPEGLEKCPALYPLFTALNGSTAQSRDQLLEKAWGSGGTINDVTNGIYRLRHNWGLSAHLHSTGYYEEKINSGQRPSAIHASTATAQPEDSPTRNALELEAERHEATLQNMHRLRELRLRARQEG